MVARHTVNRTEIHEETTAQTQLVLIDNASYRCTFSPQGTTQSVIVTCYCQP